LVGCAPPDAGTRFACCAGPCGDDVAQGTCRPDRPGAPPVPRSPVGGEELEHRSNPVLDADWPDPDVIRVGDDYWMIASSFHRAPGLPVLRSQDLVTWEHITNALPALLP